MGYASNRHPSHGLVRVVTRLFGFLLPLEVLFQAQRGAVSLIYSLALISVTVLVLVGHWIYLRLSPPTLLAGAVLMAAAGLVITSQSSALIGVYAGYGVIFGAANGLGYGFTLQLVAQACQRCVD